MNRYLSILMMVLLLIGISVSVEMETKQKDEAMRRLSGCFRDKLKSIYDGKSNDHCEKDEGCKPANLEKYLKEKQRACKKQNGELVVTFDAFEMSELTFDQHIDGAFSARFDFGLGRRRLIIIPKVSGIMNCDQAYFTVSVKSDEPTAETTQFGSCDLTFYQQNVESLGFYEGNLLTGTCSFYGRVFQTVGEAVCKKP